MQQFVLRQNIAHYRDMLQRVTDERTRHELETLLHQAEAELSLEKAKALSEGDGSKVEGSKEPSADRANKE